MECTSDKLWENGSPLQDPDCLNPSQPQGIMGQILESIRSESLAASFHSSHPQHQVLNSIYPEPPAVVSQNEGNEFIGPTPKTNQSSPQPIPEVPITVTQYQTGSSNPSSASTTPVSDTTATDTDRSEAMVEDDMQQDPEATNKEHSAE